MRRKLEIMGVGFVDQPFDWAIHELSDALRENDCKSVFFANAATLNLAHEDNSYRRTLNEASYVFGDGTGVRWAARLRSKILQSNLNGTDIIPALINRNPGVRVFLLGGSASLARRAASGFEALFPNAELVGWHHGYFDHAECADVVEKIRSAAPHLLLVGFGNPLQERWIEANRRQVGAPLTAGVGGLFSYWAGTLDRAPQSFRRWGFEWLHILLRQPRKAKRYLLGNPLFLVRSTLWIRPDSRISVTVGWITLWSTALV